MLVEAPEYDIFRDSRGFSELIKRAGWQPHHDFVYRDGAGCVWFPEHYWPQAPLEAATRD